MIFYFLLSDITLIKMLTDNASYGFQMIKQNIIILSNLKVQYSHPSVQIV